MLGYHNAAWADGRCARCPLGPNPPKRDIAEFEICCCQSARRTPSSCPDADPHCCFSKPGCGEAVSRCWEKRGMELASR
ncbi:hypothetical protein B0T16DRAFT_82910 [Cercophora newfieldiana]|uniref:Uncharacterized protein n=1 Tax=Cercophora newfieldiana TaxID=92897 RepID=A0AA39YFB9_9PEZI|nr:hypothetical protein B0T16DRAFT_82910 [Cercophora newfieldiana]